MTAQQELAMADELAADEQRGLDSPRARQLLEAARALGPVLRERSARCREQRRVPDETIADFHEAGFFKILQPRRLPLCWRNWSLHFPRACC